MQCVSWIGVVAAAVFVMASLLRWFEEVTDAVEQRWWNKTLLLVVAPFTVWFFPARVSAGRPTAVPHHEPVRGFGTVPLTPKAQSPSDQTGDGPPPGTPKEFIGPPKIPAKKSPRATIDPEKLAQLKQKMREQGMIDDEA